ncbi:hypothetical protein MED152_16977 [Polaribacter sp. MED152]|nr:hypothetical protein MED152_16977 [Polaribacter sp. MED152]
MNAKKIKRLDVNPKSDILYTRITKAKNIQLQNLADDYGLKKSTIVRTAINEYLSSHA